MSYKEIAVPIRTTFAIAAEAKEEIIALQIVCAALINELAMASIGDAKANQIRILTSLQEVAAGMAQNDDQIPTKRITHVIDNISQMAELGLVLS